MPLAPDHRRGPASLGTWLAEGRPATAGGQRGHGEAHLLGAGLGEGLRAATEAETLSLASTLKPGIQEKQSVYFSVMFTSVSGFTKQVVRC